MTKNKVVILYDYTGIMAKPWLDKGFEVWIFDGQHPEGVTVEGNLRKVGMWFDAYKTDEHAKEIAQLVGNGVRMVFGFPECTHLTVAGARHFAAKREANPNFQKEALALALLVEKVASALWTSCWAFENPVSVISSMWRQPNFMFDPKHYGGYLEEGSPHPLYPDIYPPQDAYNKNTCIWHGPGFVRPARKPVKELYSDNPGWKKCGGKSTRTKNIRSATPRGFSYAVFEHNHK